jgi:hypothetical protein
MATNQDTNLAAGPEPNPYCSNRSPAGDACGACPGCEAELARIRRWRVAVHYGYPLDAQGFRALRTVRRTLLGLLSHGAITDLETVTSARSHITEWSWRAGSEDPEGVRAGLLDVLAAIAPKTWTVK